MADTCCSEVYYAQEGGSYYLSQGGIGPPGPPGPIPPPAVSLQGSTPGTPDGGNFNLDGTGIVGTNLLIGAGGAGGGAGVIGVHDAVTVPTTNPPTGIVLYSQGHILKYRDSTGAIITLDGTPHGTASGDLSGTYPAPVVAQLQGRPLASTAPTTGQVVAWSGSAWMPTAATPLTTQDDLIVAGASGVPARLAKGSDGTVLTVDPTTHHLLWAPPVGFANPMTTAGDLILGGTAGAPTRLAPGADSTILTMDPITHLPIWGPGAVSALVAPGDLLYFPNASYTYGGTDRAAGKTVTVSTDQGGSSAPGHAVDGNDATYWGGTTGTYHQWVQVDLGAVYTLGKMRLLPLAGYVFAWDLQYSADGVTGWTTVLSVPVPSGANLTFTPASAQFWRVLCTDTVASYPSVATLELYEAFTTSIPTRLPIGTAGQHLGVVSGLPAWVDPPPGGTFTLSASATTTVTDTTVTAGCLIALMPTNAAAALLPVYVSARIASTSFDVTTGSGLAAAGTETYAYRVLA